MSRTPSSPRRGRRPGSPDTRADILDAARTRFAEAGFGGTTVRAVAAEAGVDAALVHHYFGTKADLFVASLAVPVDPRELLAPVIAQGPGGAAARMLVVLLSVWDDPDLQPAMLATARSMFDPTSRLLFAQGFLTAVLEPIGTGLGIDDPQRRMALVASQVVGLILGRYVLAVPALAAMSRDEVVAAYAPTLQRYLTGDLSGDPD